MLDIRDEEELANAERELTRAAASEIEFSLPPYNLQYLKSLHRQLFQEIYEWAGELRTIDISRDETRFCKVDRIEPEADRIFADLARAGWLEGSARSHLVKEAAEYYGDLNMVNPFRDGNGRAQRLLFEHLIINAGYQISWDPVTEQEWIQANIDAVVCDYRGLEQVFEKCIGAALPE